MIEKETLWVLSNIVCCDIRLLYEAFAKGLIAEAFNLVKRMKDNNAKNEMSYVIYNILDRNHEAEITKLLEYEVVELIENELSLQISPTNVIIQWLKTLKMLFERCVTIDNRSLITK